MLCVCSSRGKKVVTQSELSEQLRHLVLKKTKLSSFLRSKTSAPDNRTSATSVGVLGIVTLSVVTIALVFVDMSHAGVWIAQMFGSHTRYRYT